MKTELLDQLKVPFLASEHQDRILPGGGKWFFIPWQQIRKRLNEVCPDWSVSYSDPVILREYVVVRCQRTLEGLTREGVGNDKAYPEKQPMALPSNERLLMPLKMQLSNLALGPTSTIKNS